MRKEYLDNVIGHQTFGAIIPPTVFAALGQASPKTLEAVVNYLGPELLAAFPTIGVGVACMLGGAQIAKRKYQNKPVNDSGEFSLHLPGTRSLTRSEAVSMIAFAWALQTANAIAQLEDPESDAAQTLAAMFNNTLFTSYGQILIGLMFDKMSPHLAIAGNHAAAGISHAAKSTAEGISHAATLAGEGISYVGSLAGSYMSKSASRVSTFACGLFSRCNNKSQVDESAHLVAVQVQT